METTVGQVIINDMLPEDMRDYNRVWDKKTKGKVLTELARRHPDQFKEVAHNLLRFGARAAYETGGQSFGAEDIVPTKVSQEFQKDMSAKMQSIMERAYKRGKTSQDPEVQQEIADAAIPWMAKIDKGIDKELGYDNPFYRQAFGTGAQKPGTLRSIVGADVFYVDQNNKRVPIPVTHGYAQGLTPAEYFIQSFGTRKGMVDLQKATQDAGFLCLARGSQVRMADMSVKQIEHIKEGDWVLGIEDDLDNPKGKPVQVTHLFDNGIRNCYKTVFAGDTTLISTLRHKILANNKKEHNEVIPVGASKELRAITIQGKAIPIKEQKVMGRLHTYDIEVDSPNHLFVLANGLIVSNSKQLVQIAHRLVVTDKDDPDPNGFDPNMPVGYPVDTDDPDNEGAYLAVPVGGYPRNTLLTPKILGELKSKGIDNIIIRSVMVGGPANGGVYAYDCGIREKGRLPSQGDFVGINAVQSISEPLTQGAISSKHSGGVAGADSGKAISGFKYINQLIQVPKHFQGGATHAETDGIVGKIEDAPQGGKYLYINGIQHYIGRTQDGDIPILVKKGDRVEAGDVLTEGIPNPAMIVKYKGIGEGRRYFTNMFRNALNNAGTPVHRRNIEALSRGLINYVRLNEEVGDYAPDDVIPYSMIEKDYKPRKDAVVGNPNNLEECYLERPVLHYSIGTQLRPSVIKELQKYGIKQVCAHRDPPPFESEMIRGMAHVSYDPDWATRLLGAYNKDSLLEGARRGATSSAESTSYVPAITFGEGDFGHIGPLKQGSIKQAGVWGEIIKQADMTSSALNIPDTLNIPDNVNINGVNITVPNSINLNGQDISIPKTIDLSNIKIPDGVTIPKTDKNISTKYHFKESPDFSQYTKGYGVFNPVEGRDLFRVITDIPTFAALQNRSDPRGTYANLRGTAYTMQKDPINALINWTNFGIAYPPNKAWPFTKTGPWKQRMPWFLAFEELARPDYSIGSAVRSKISPLIRDYVLQESPESTKQINNLLEMGSNLNALPVENIDVNNLKQQSNRAIQTGNYEDIAVPYLEQIIDQLDSTYKFNPKINGALYDWITRGDTDAWSLIQAGRYAPEVLESAWSLMRPGTAAVAAKAVGAGPFALAYGSEIAKKELANWYNFYKHRAYLSDMGFKWDPVTASPILESQDGTNIYYTPATYTMTGWESTPKDYNSIIAIRDPNERAKRNVLSQHTGVILGDGSYVKAYTPYLQMEGNALTPFTERDPKYALAVRSLYEPNSKFRVLRDMQGNPYPATRPDNYPITAIKDTINNLFRPATEFMGWTNHYNSESDTIDLDSQRIKKGNEVRELVVLSPAWQKLVRLSLENPSYLDQYIDNIDDKIDELSNSTDRPHSSAISQLSAIRTSIINLQRQLNNSYIPEEFVPGQSDLVAKYFEALNSKNWYQANELREQILKLRQEGRKRYLGSLPTTNAHTKQWVNPDRVRGLGGNMPRL